MEVELWTQSASWDAYVQQTPGASNYHQWRWKQVIEETYGHPTYYLAAVDQGDIQGVLPLVGIRSWLFGRYLVSLPFLNYGGWLISSPQVRPHLLAKAAEVARHFGAQHVELRQGDASDGDLHHVAAKVAMLVHLPDRAEDLWNQLSSRLRNKVRHAQKHGFQCRWGGSDLVSSFYRVFAANMRNLGTPVYPSAWFENLCRIVPEARILTLWEGDQPVAATLLTAFRDTVELPWIASSPQGRSQYSTILLYWTALEWAVTHGYRVVDLGRCTPGSGTHRFKQQWNPEEKPLHWYYWLAPGASVPALRPENPRFRLAIRVWQRLPLWLTNRLGPRIVRSIP